MWSIAIPLLIVLASGQMAVLLRPKLWGGIRRRGVRWHHYLVLVVLPVGLASLLLVAFVARLEQWQPLLSYGALSVVGAELAQALLAILGIRSVASAPR